MKSTPVLAIIDLSASWREESRNVRLRVPRGKFLKSEDGPTAVEYGVMLALILVAIITIVGTLGSSISEHLQQRRRLRQLMGRHATPTIPRAPISRASDRVSGRSAVPVTEEDDS